MSLSVQKVREQDVTIDFQATLIASDFENELNKWFQNKSQTIRLPGFRPGKVPIDVVKTRFTQDATTSVVRQLIDRTLKLIDQEHQIRVSGQPQITIEKADAKEGFACKVVVECLPTFALQDFSKINCEELVVEIDEKEIDNFLHKLLEHAPEGAKLDDELAKQFNCDNLAELREKMRQTYENDQKNLIYLFHKRQVLDSLAKQYTFTVPKSAEEYELRQIMQQLEREITESKKRGDYEDTINLAEVEVEYREIARRRVKLGLLISEISKVHQLKITEADLKNAITYEAMRSPEHSKEIIAYYSKNDGALQNLSSQIMEDKVVNLVFEKATKKKVKISSKDLPAKLSGIVPGFEAETAADQKTTTATKASKKKGA